MIAVIVVLRLVVPLLIPRFTLPALLASLVIDGVDGGIFAGLESVDTSWYQSYDKALDIYYLALTYLAVRRNWPDLFSVRVAAALWYYRLVGVLLFEITDARWLLMVFPNTFEYLVIAVEVVRTRWSPLRLSRRRLVLLAALIWVVVKLPQEWWIHVAQLDFTDEFARRVLGVEPGTGLVAGLAHRPWVGVLLLALVVGVVLLVRWGRPRLPVPDWRFTVDADRVSERIGWLPSAEAAAAAPRRSFLDAALAEKVLLVALVTTVLVLVYPGPAASPGQAFTVIALAVVAHAAASAALHRAGWNPRSWLLRGAVDVAVTALALLALTALVGGRRGLLTAVDLAFFTYVVALVVLLFDATTARRAVRPVLRPVAGPLVSV